MSDEFEKIVGKYYSDVYRFVFVMVRDTNDAADVTQETFLKIKRYLKGFRGDSSQLTWIFRIASNEVKRFFNEQRHELPNIAFENDCLSSEGLLDLSDALKKLGKDDYELIYFRFSKGMSEREISFILDIPEGTVKSRLYNAKKKLKEVMEDGR